MNIPEITKDHIFEEVNRGRYRAKNRLFRSAAVTLNTDPSGRINDEVIGIYEKMAAGGVGTICYEAVPVLRYERLTQDFFNLPKDQMLGSYVNYFDSDDMIEEHKRLVSAVKKYDTQIVMQLVLSTYKRKNEDGSFNPVDLDNLTGEEFKEIENAFVDCAIRASKAGYDGIQLHLAHGFFLCRLISRFCNHRTDEYGTDRLKLIRNIYKRIRDNVSEDFQIGVKINEYEFMTDEQEKEEGSRNISAVPICKELFDMGFDLVEFSGKPAMRCGIKPYENEAYFQDSAYELKKLVSLNKDKTVAVTGGNRSPQYINSLYLRTGIDVYGICRPLIREANLPNRWKSGDLRASKCLSCNRCGSAVDCPFEE